MLNILIILLIYAERVSSPVLSTTTSFSFDFICLPELCFHLPYEDLPKLSVDRRSRVLAEFGVCSSAMLGLLSFVALKTVSQFDT